MYKIVLICTLLSSLVFGDYKSRKVVDELIGSIVLNNQISVYAQDKNLFNETQNFKQTFDCQDANVIIVENLRSVSKKCINKDKIIILTNYRSYQMNEEAIGAIFMQKGRLNLVFRQKRLKELSLYLPNKYKQYIE